jgi:hypothetical protein
LPIPCATRKCYPSHISPPPTRRTILEPGYSSIHSSSTRLKLHHTKHTMSVHNPQIAKCTTLNSPVRPLLVQHTMTTVPAADRLAALERYVLIAVAAFVVDGAGVGVDDGGVGRGGLGWVVLLGRHGCALWFVWISSSGRVAVGVWRVGSLAGKWKSWRIDCWL